MSASRSQQLLDLHAGWNARSPSSPAKDAAVMGILDVVGCIVAGSATPTAQKARALAVEQGVAPQSSVLGTNVRLAAPLAAFANGVAGHVLDYDDMNSTMIAHPSVVLVPPLLALAEARSSPGRDVLSAYIFGFEVDGWFGRILCPRHYDAGWHATSSLGIFGAAAGAARLLGLDGAATVNALAIAASNVAGLRANFGSMTKSLHAGQAAEAGLRAALLSGKGFTANREVFDGPGGFFETYGENPKPRALDPGRLELEASGIGIKPYACCGAGVSVIDAGLAIREGGPIAAADIVSVECRVSDMAVRIMPFQAAADGLQAKYCLAYCAAVSLIDGRGGLAQFEDGRVLESDVQELLRRTKVSMDPRMAWGAGRFGVEMTVRLANGTARESKLEIPRGHPTRPLDADQLLAKFLECASPVVGEAAARDAARQLRALESLATLQPAIRLLGAPG